MVKSIENLKKKKIIYFYLENKQRLCGLAIEAESILPKSKEFDKRKQSGAHEFA